MHRKSVILGRAVTGLGLSVPVLLRRSGRNKAFHQLVSETQHQQLPRYPRGSVVRAPALHPNNGYYIVAARCSRSLDPTAFRRHHPRPKMSGELPPLHGLSHDDHGAYCIISTSTWACITGLTATARFGLVWHRKLKIGWDDISFAIATVSGP